MQATAPQLSKQEVQQVLAVLRDINPSAKPSDLRKYQRHSVATPVWIKKFARGTQSRAQLFKVMLTDASRRGLGLLSRRIFQSGESFVVPLRYAEGGGALVLCRTRFCRSTSTGHYRIGAEFTATLPDPDGNAKIPAEWVPDPLA